MPEMKEVCIDYSNIVVTDFVLNVDVIVTGLETVNNKHYQTLLSIIKQYSCSI